MRIEILDIWRFKNRSLLSREAIVVSSYMSFLLSACIFASLLFLVYVKYCNHLMYSELKFLDNKNLVMYSDQKELMVKRVRAMSFDAVQDFVLKHGMDAVSEAK